MDQARQGRNKHRSSERQGGTKMLEIRFVYAGGVFSEEFGDQCFAPKLSYNCKNLTHINRK